MATLGISAALVSVPVAAYADEPAVPEGGVAVVAVEGDGPEAGGAAAGAVEEGAGAGPQQPAPGDNASGAPVENGDGSSSSSEGDATITDGESGNLGNQTPAGQPSEEAGPDPSPTLPAGEVALSGVQSAGPAPAAPTAAGDGSEQVDSGAADAAPEEDAPLEGTWVVRDAGDGTGLQRYYVKESGECATGLFKALLSGVESWFYGYGDGRVVRGRYTVEGEGGRSYTYLADNDGRLLSPGWHVTDGFGQGLQRYYVDADAHACVEGYSSDGWGHYTRPEGYVVRGKWDTGRGGVVLADNDGRAVSGTGWLVTGAYDGGILQRYWLKGDGQARSSYFEVGSEKYFGLGDEGYVLRGVGTGVDGYRLFADNDGKLARSQWVVTTALGNGLQRYWFDSDAHLAANRFIEISEGSGWRAYALSDGRILRGGTTVKGKKYFADNDGRLAASKWVVTDAFTPGNLQRYWATSDGSFRTSDGTFNPKDFFTDGGWLAYALSDGTIFRGKHDTKRGSVFLADNDGRISTHSVGWFVTGIYDGGTLQRYYMNGDGTAKSGFFTDPSTGRLYFGVADEGYVLRGTTSWGAYVLLADNDGVMPDSEGWLVSDDFGQSLQRYMIDEIASQPGYFGALTGYFSVKSDGSADTSGKDYYGRKEGYVVRGYYVIPGTDTLLYADNDGVLKPLTESPIVMNILKKIFWKSSATRYLIGVDVVNCWVVVFQGSAGNWNPLHVWRCVTGAPSKHNGQGSPRGDYSIGGDGADYNWKLGNYTPGGYRTTYWAKSDVYYFTGFCLNLGFHSTKRVNGGFTDTGGQLGNRISDGCIRLEIDNAKWIYDNCTPGTKVTLF